MPNQNLNVCVVAVDIATGKPAENLSFVENKINEVNSDTDLIVLPELFTTNFIPDANTLSKLAERNNGPTMTAITRLAHTSDCAIAGSFLATDDEGRLYNRGFIALPDGDNSFYDKRHLFRHGGEHDTLTPGSHLAPVVNYKSWRLKMAICYDIRFPAWNRNTEKGCDCLIVPANWADARAYAWRHMLIARAIENQVCVIGANRTGVDGSGNFPISEIRIFNQWGKDIAVTNERAGLVYATFEGERLDLDRKRFPVWLDADKFEII